MKSVLLLAVILIFVQGIFVHAQSNLILGSEFTANVEANQYYHFSFSLIQGGVDNQDLSFTVNQADASNIVIYASFDNQPSGKSYLMRSNHESGVNVIYIPRSLYDGKTYLFISVFAFEATRFVMTARAQSVFWNLQLGEPITVTSLGSNGSKFYFEFHSNIDTATSVEWLYVILTHDSLPESEVPFVYIGSQGNVPSALDYTWTIQGPIGRDRKHHVKLDPSVVGQYYGVAISRSTEPGAQFTLRLATTEFLRPEVWARMWLGAAIGGGILLVGVIIALSVSCTTAKRNSTSKGNATYERVNY